MSSLILTEADGWPDNITGELRNEAFDAFLKTVGTLGPDSKAIVTSINASVAVRLHVYLVLRALQYRHGPTEAHLNLCRDALDTVCGVELTPAFDDMYVSYLGVGLVAFLDLMEDALSAEERTRLLGKIAECRDWLAEARSRRPFGRRENEGTYAWNHSVVAGAALTLCTLWCDRRSGPDIQNMKFGLRRIDAFFQHGIRDGGIPYEGFFYCGVVFRILGLFDILCRRDETIFREYHRSRTAWSEKLGQMLDWYGSNAISQQKLLISYNHSPYQPNAAIGGLLPFFRRHYNQKASEIWGLLTRRDGGEAFGQARDLSGVTCHEAALFLNSKVGKTPRYTKQSQLHREEGYLLAVSEDQKSQIFVKASKYLFGPHNQSDAGHVTWVSDGKLCLMDCGPGTKVRATDKKWAQYSLGSYKTEGSEASSYGHNAVLIDGKGQRPSGDGSGVESSIRYFTQADRFWLVGVDMAPAYNVNDYNPVSQADRHIAFDPATVSEIFLVDHVVPKQEGSHRFDRLLHVASAQKPESGTGLETTLGSGRWEQVTSANRPVSVTTLSSEGTLGTEADVDAVFQPINRKLCLSHHLTARELCLYTVICSEGSDFFGAEVDLIEHAAALNGQALALRTKSGEVRLLFLNPDRTLTCTAVRAA